MCEVARTAGLVRALGHWPGWHATPLPDIAWGCAAVVRRVIAGQLEAKDFSAALASVTRHKTLFRPTAEVQLQHLTALAALGRFVDLRALLQELGHLPRVLLEGFTLLARHRQAEILLLSARDAASVANAHLMAVTACARVSDYALAEAVVESLAPGSVARDQALGALACAVPHPAALLIKHGASATTLARVLCQLEPQTPATPLANNSAAVEVLLRVSAAVPLGPGTPALWNSVVHSALGCASENPLATVLHKLRMLGEPVPQSPQALAFLHAHGRYDLVWTLAQYQPDSVQGNEDLLLDSYGKLHPGRPLTRVLESIPGTGPLVCGVARGVEDPGHRLQVLGQCLAPDDEVLLARAEACIALHAYPEAFTHIQDLRYYTPQVLAVCTLLGELCESDTLTRLALLLSSRGVGGLQLPIEYPEYDSSMALSESTYLHLTLSRLEAREYPAAMTLLRDWSSRYSGIHPHLAEAVLEASAYYYPVAVLLHDLLGGDLSPRMYRLVLQAVVAVHVIDQGLVTRLMAEYTARHGAPGVELSLLAAEADIRQGECSAVLLHTVDPDTSLRPALEAYYTGLARAYVFAGACDRALELVDSATTDRYIAADTRALVLVEAGQYGRASLLHGFDVCYLVHQCLLANQWRPVYRVLNSRGRSVAATRACTGRLLTEYPERVLALVSALSGNITALQYTKVLEALGTAQRYEAAELLRDMALREVPAAYLLVMSGWVRVLGATGRWRQALDQHGHEPLLAGAVMEACVANGQQGDRPVHGLPEAAAAIKSQTPEQVLALARRFPGLARWSSQSAGGVMAAHVALRDWAAVTALLHTMRAEGLEVRDPDLIRVLHRQGYSGAGLVSRRHSDHFGRLQHSVN